MKNPICVIADLDSCGFKNDFRNKIMNVFLGKGVVG